MEEVKWLEDLEAQLSGIDISQDEEQISKKHSIFRVPAPIKDASINSYEPQMVSIGPYHHGKLNLQLMEHHKRRLFAQFLKRTGRSIREYAKALDPVLEELIGAYEQLDEEWRNKERFLQLMLIDGCFLLQSFRSTELRFASPDTILGSGHLTPHLIVLRDILMLENQIPLLALIKLRCVESNMSFEEAKVNIVHNLFLENDSFQFRGEILHLLHLFREYFLYDPRPIPNSYFPTKYTFESAPSATKLQEAGVVLQRFPQQNPLHYVTNITFENGVLTLPTLVINEFKGATHRNEMALERRHREVGNGITTFWAFIFSLVNSVQDAALLKSKGLIAHQLESDETVVELIKELGKDSFLDEESRLYGVRCSLNEYYDKKTEKWSRRFREWRLNLKQSYFSNPWTAISVFAAAFLLLLTLVQTYYSVRSYYKTN